MRFRGGSIGKAWDCGHLPWGWPLVWAPGGGEDGDSHPWDGMGISCFPSSHLLERSSVPHGEPGHCQAGSHGIRHFNLQSGNYSMCRLIGFDQV